MPEREVTVWAYPELPSDRRFIEKVIGHCENTPRARAALRSTVGISTRQTAAAADEVVVAALEPTDLSMLSVDSQRAYYTIAAMIAAVPAKAKLRPGGPDRTNPYGRDLGRCLASAVADKTLSEAAARRHLELLTKQDLEGLHLHLPGTVALIPEGIDWITLLRNLRNWSADGDAIARRWRQGFFHSLLAAQRAAAEAADTEGGNSSESAA